MQTNNTQLEMQYPLDASCESIIPLFLNSPDRPFRVDLLKQDFEI